jgi:RHS repeat-associated protein
VHFLFISILAAFLSYSQLSPAKSNILDIGKGILKGPMVKRLYLGQELGPCYTFLVCNFEFGNIKIGSSRTFDASYLVYGVEWDTFRQFTITGSSDFTITDDTCTGNEFNNDYCYFKITFTPSSSGQKHATVTWPMWMCTIEGCTPEESEDYQSTLELYGESVEEPPQEPCTRCGSTILVDGQSVIEEMPIAGTGFSLVYSSQFAPEYVSPFNTLGVKNPFNQHGLTVSAVHFYDSDQRKLYLGTGFSRVVTPTVNGMGKYVVTASDGQEVYVFDPDGTHLRTLYPLTGQTKYLFTYDTGNRLTQISDAFGNVTTFSRDGSGDLTQIQGPGGQVTTITLTGSKLIDSITNPNSEQYELTYKTGTRLIETFEESGGQIKTFTYDTYGKLTKDEGNGGDYKELALTSTSPTKVFTITSKMGRVETVELWKDSGQPYYRIETAADGSQKTYAQDFFNKIISETFDQKTVVRGSTLDGRFGSAYLRPLSVSTTIGTNTSTTSFGQTVSYSTTPHTPFNFSTLTSTETTSGRTKTSVYNSSTKTTTNTSAEGVVSTLEIDSYERPVSYALGADTAWTLSYYTSGKLHEIAQGTHKKQTLTWNTDGTLGKIKNVRNEETTFGYDLAGRVTSVTLPDLRVISYSYDSNGNVTGVTPPNRPIHSLTYNAFELLSSYEPPSLGVGITKDTTYTYNNDKQITLISRPDGQDISFTYHSTYGRLTKMTTPLGDYNYHYDGTTKRLNRIDSPAGIYDSFDFYGDLVSASYQKRSGDDLLFGAVNWTYDTDYRVASRTIRGNAATPTSTINYAYNDDDQPVTVGDLALSYSSTSGRLSGTSIDNISDSYSYDSYGDVTGYTATYNPTSGSPTTLYSYTLTRDNGGRISQKVETIAGVTSTYVYSYDSAGRLTLVKKNGTTTDSFTYDDNSNRTSGVIGGTSFSATYDDQDRLATLGPRTYTYNNNGDLTRIQWSGTPSDKSDFVYDVMGNLEQVTLPSGTVLDYVNDGLDRRAVKKSAGSFVFRYLYENKYRISAIMNGMNAYVKEFVYATRVNVPDYLIAGGSNYKIITDHLGSPRLMVRTSDGVVAQRMDYSTLGTVVNDTNPGFQPFGFAGGIYDPSTQLVRFGARDYDPRSTGRWTTKDPIRFNGGDTNLYGYVLNDPINFVDPHGFAATDSPFSNIMRNWGKKLDEWKTMWEFRGTPQRSCPKEPKSTPGTPDVDPTAPRPLFQNSSPESTASFF